MCIYIYIYIYISSEHTMVIFMWKDDYTLFYHTFIDTETATSFSYSLFEEKTFFPYWKIDLP